MTEKNGVRHFYQVKHSRNPVSFEDLGIRRMMDNHSATPENITIVVRKEIANPHEQLDRKILEKLKKIYTESDVDFYLQKLYQLLQNHFINTVEDFCQFAGTTVFA